MQNIVKCNAKHRKTHRFILSSLIQYEEEFLPDFTDE